MKLVWKKELGRDGSRMRNQEALPVRAADRSEAKCRPNEDKLLISNIAGKGTMVV